MSLEPVMELDALSAFLDEVFPQVNQHGPAYSIIGIKPGEVTMRLVPGEAHLRPGGTVSGPTLFTLADLAAYVAILAHIGPVALAVTTNLSINFLRKPAMEPLLGICRILKLGKRLAVVEVTIVHETGDEPVAHATATYSIPPR